MVFLLLILLILLVIYVLDDPERKSSETANTFGIKTNTGEVKKVDLKNIKFATHEVLLDCDSYFYLHGSYNKLNWKGNKINLENSLENYNYVNSISKFELDNGEESYFFTLINLRATSERSLLIIFKYPDEIVFEELLERPKHSIYLILGFREATNEGVITVSSYIGDYPDDYNLCSLDKKFDEKDFKLLEYGYQFSD